MLKETVTTVTEHFFPGISYAFSGKRDCDLKKNNNEVISNFPLQMALYFNVVLLPVWLTTILVMLPLKYDKLPALHKVILVIALTATILIEITRLYMGYFGNQTENIPEVAGFWMLSVLLQSPLQVLLIFVALQSSSVEIVVQTVMCCLLAIELVSGFISLNNIAKHSSAKFHISHFLSANQNED